MKNRRSSYVFAFILLLVSPGMVVKFSLLLVGTHFALKVILSIMNAVKISSFRAVLIGHCLISFPILLLALVYFLLSPYLVNKGLLTFFTQLFFFVCSWLWWSILLPHWQQWASARVDDKQKLNSLSIKTGLKWGEDSIFSKVGH